MKCRLLTKNLLIIQICILTFIQVGNSLTGTPCPEKKQSTSQVFTGITFGQMPIFPTSWVISTFDIPAFALMTFFLGSLVLSTFFHQNQNAQNVCVVFNMVKINLKRYLFVAPILVHILKKSHLGRGYLENLQFHQNLFSNDICS